MRAQPLEMALDALGDVELAARAEQGDGGAFRLIVQRNNRRLFRLARSVVRDDSEAEDVVQETYARAAANLARFRGDARLSTWLARIALNEALGRLRRRRPTVGVDAIDDTRERRGDVLMFPGVTATPDPETAAARAEVRRLLERAVDGLPDRFRLVFIMRDVEGMSVEETAEHLDLRPETVKTRLFRARQQLRRSLDATLASALTGAFPFDGERCGRFTERVLARLGFADAGAVS
jgi:RNA polymerase sigma-70 factor (ECF subfamily)